jgi:hypothetical protein
MTSKSLPNSIRYPVVGGVLHLSHRLSLERKHPGISIRSISRMVDMVKCWVPTPLTEHSSGEASSLSLAESLDPATV